MRSALIQHMAGGAGSAGAAGSAARVPGADQAAKVRAELEREVIDVFIRVAGLLGLPRSVGELYGCLYISPRALPMDELQRRLDLSKGATSQGLKLLRAFGAVRTVYVPGDRRDHFTAETELRNLVEGFLREQVQPHLTNGTNRVGHIRELAGALPANERRWYEDRVARLAKWHGHADRLLPFALKLIQT